MPGGPVLMEGQRGLEGVPGRKVGGRRSKLWTGKHIFTWTRAGGLPPVLGCLQLRTDWRKEPTRKVLKELSLSHGSSCMIAMKMVIKVFERLPGKKNAQAQRSTTRSPVAPVFQILILQLEMIIQKSLFPLGNSVFSPVFAAS